MPRPRRPSTKSIKLIYDSLAKSPKCFGDIVKETGLHRNTVATTLNFLVEKKMLKRYREKKGHEVMYEIVAGWETHWIELMMTKEDWKRKWKEVDNEIEDHLKRKRLKNFKTELMTFLHEKLIEPNRALAKVLRELDMNVPIEIFLKHLERPYCMECLKTKKELKRTSFKDGEYVCTECGIVAETEPFEKRSSPSMMDRIRHLWRKRMKDW